ncbi:zinc-binding dehydrogenase [Anaerocolumna sp. AGMB13020]|uniref:zinc-binding dehydrogenase n=1 Tax=Anaerocolumna sp. AGMB13020 TaxID=3081750 RepID=UPI0029533E6D|nr:zinc-binding dehydrogenase [Anaerocolumna sp. AGMB13020]WOO38372.1 zinc-binding dehydrogenase [Anaerocolumna sp. AGMB13020]
MKSKAVRMYGEDDLRLEEFQLPPIKEDEILVKIISDSICMSTYKLVKQGKKHKRSPQNIDTNPIIIGHECAGIIVEVGKKWEGKYKAGDKFALQPALNYKGRLDSPGYSYEYCGGACTYCIMPQEVMELGCLLPYNGESFFEASLGEPMSCIIGGYHANYHTNKQNYQHAMGTKTGGSILILGGCGPMGLGAVSYGLYTENKPKRIVVTDISEARIENARQMISPEEAKKKGIELIYINTAALEDPVSVLRELTEDHGYDDVFVYVPNKAVVEMADALLAFDGCMNFFAGPTNGDFTSEINMYNIHYISTHVIGTTGGNNDDLLEALDLAAKGEIRPAVMVTHIGGIDSIAEATINLPTIPGGKKLTYTQFDMPLTAIEDFEELGKKEELFRRLNESVKKHKGLWNVEAEKILFEHHGIS